MITAITCTGDRPTPLGLSVKYMARQTRKPDKWIVVDDGQVPLDFKLQQQIQCCGVDRIEIVRRAPQRYDPAHTLSVNVLAALDRVTDDCLVFIEDDDWYGPEHVEIVARELQAHDMFGFQGIVYYHVGKRCYRTMGETSPHSSLCQTGITAKAIPALKRICSTIDVRTSGFIDLRLWGSFVGNKKLSLHCRTVVGIKGLPGRIGLTAGWRSSNGYTPDPSMAFLESLIGADVENYRQIFPASHGPSHDDVRQPNSSTGAPG